jgi:hypothetical protein
MAKGLCPPSTPSVRSRGMGTGLVIQRADSQLDQWTMEMMTCKLEAAQGRALRSMPQS